MATRMLYFQVRERIANLELADYPQSHELSAALERLGVECFGDVKRLSLQDLRSVSEVPSAVALELGSLIRRAERGEFGYPAGEPCFEKAQRVPTWTSPTEPPGEAISIPKGVRGLPLSMFQMSVRLHNILRTLEFSQAGDLHGRPYKHFLRLRNCGPKTLQELRKLVQQIRESPAEGPQPVPYKKSPRLKVTCSFAIPKEARHLVPYELPVSRVLDGVLRRKGITRLGDLHGMAFSELRMLNGCGPKTVNELLALIERAGAGEDSPNLLFRA